MCYIQHLHVQSMRGFIDFTSDMKNSIECLTVSSLFLEVIELTEQQEERHVLLCHIFYDMARDLSL